MIGITRDTDSNSSVNYTLTHDAVGNMTDDGKDYKFVYDALGRLKTVKNQSNTVVAEYTYNGLNMRIGWHYDADADADVDANDPWYSFAMDNQWRLVATFRGSDTSPKELFAYHAAGSNGRGSSSSIDSVILRNKDANTAWTTASDATLEERLYYVQNWRADVSAILTSAGLVKEWVKYTSYGIPVRIDPGDYNRDGFVNGTDSDDYGDDFDNTRAEADVDFDGDVDGDDYDLFSAWWGAPSAAGRFTLSASSVANRIGYAGYQYDPTFVGASRAVYHVRNRVYDAGLGRWTRRDPVGYVDGMSLFAYAKSQPQALRDPVGLRARGSCHHEDPYADVSSLEFACSIGCQALRDKSKDNEDTWGFTDCNVPPRGLCCICDFTIASAIHNITAQMIANVCTEAHEADHLSRCSKGGSKFPSLPKACDECLAYQKDVECLTNALESDACGSDVNCESKLLDMIEDATNRMNDFCDTCGAIGIIVVPM